MTAGGRAVWAASGSERANKAVAMRGRGIGLPCESPNTFRVPDYSTGETVNSRAFLALPRYHCLFWASGRDTETILLAGNPNLAS
jgi:hypothetical protein